MAETTTLERTIARPNAQRTGFLTIEEPGQWLNLSRFASPAPTIPAAGSRVRLTLDGKGFVRTIEPTTTAPLSSRTPTPEAPRTPVPNQSATDTRLTLLQAAAAFLAPRSEAKSTDVIAVAQVWESWLRTGQPPTA